MYRDVPQQSAWHDCVLMCTPLLFSRSMLLVLNAYDYEDWASIETSLVHHVAAALCIPPDAYKVVTWRPRKVKGGGCPVVDLAAGLRQLTKARGADKPGGCGGARCRCVCVGGGGGREDGGQEGVGRRMGGGRQDAYVLCAGCCAVCCTCRTLCAVCAVASKQRHVSIGAGVTCCAASTPSGVMQPAAGDRQGPTPCAWLYCTANAHACVFLHAQG
jgi:hypothetical protein